MLSANMLNVKSKSIMLSVIMLSVIMLNVAAPTPVLVKKQIRLLLNY